MDITYNAKQILQRYADKGAFHAVNGFEDLKRAGVQGDFILSLLDLFEDESTFIKENFDRFPIPVITDYIRRTHRYYLEKKLPEIEQSVQMLLSGYSEEHPILFLLRSFYNNYRKDLTDHIRAEEELLLPYVDLLQRFQESALSAHHLFRRTAAGVLQKFMTQHHGTEEDLKQVRETIMQYQPPALNQTPYRILLLQLQSFEKDLTVHSIIEDYVLVPRALLMEEIYNEQLRAFANHN